MPNTIPICKPVQCGNVSDAIVGDDFLNGTLVAEDVFEDGGTKSVASLGAKCMPFWPSGEQAVSLSDVAKASDEGHKHGVDISLVEEWSDSGWDVDLDGLARLASMASVNIPANIVLKQEPPEVVGDDAASGIEALVAEFIVSGTDEGKALLRQNEQLLVAVVLVPPESSTLQQERLNLAEEAIEDVAMKV